MKNRIIKILLFTAVIIIVAIFVCLNKKIEEKDELISGDVLKASQEFKTNLATRLSTVDVLVPHLKKGLPEKEVLVLLGAPDKELTEEHYTSIAYTLSWADNLLICFDEKGKVLQVRAPSIEFLSTYDMNWIFIRPGMTKKEANDMLGNNQKELEGGRKWQFHAQRVDPYYYNIYFDENDKVIKFEKTEMKKN